MQPENPENSLKSLHASHPRHWRDNLYVYPVISRRGGGLSIGVNLNPDKVCNFHCVYCQVDRLIRPEVTEVDPERLRDELAEAIRASVSGEIFASLPFSRVPASNRQIRDIAFSGDGEPTASPAFLDAVEIAAGVRQQFKLWDTRLILITNATCLDQPKVRQALEVMDANNGEIWAKLDAGTEEHYSQVNRSGVSFDHILANILQAALPRPVVIQSLWMNLHGQPPPDHEVKAFAGRLRSIVEQGGRIRLVQVYTVARRTVEPFVTPLGDDALALIAQEIRATVGLPVETYGS
jgi:wyosine [tRNA(Phe)-imidazoG37] synthetase (radical SAM superfamily)